MIEHDKDYLVKCFQNQFNCRTEVAEKIYHHVAVMKPGVWVRSTRPDLEGMLNDQSWAESLWTYYEGWSYEDLRLFIRGVESHLEGFVASRKDLWY